MGPGMFPFTTMAAREKPSGATMASLMVRSVTGPIAAYEPTAKAREINVERRDCFDMLGMRR